MVYSPIVNKCPISTYFLIECLTEIF
uniref:Uncharacterized protein n=1 Tax=Lepeophtheirus salmonis TaxID=72036 RepID=A0A0K2SVD5_LEPSM